MTNAMTDKNVSFYCRVCNHKMKPVCLGSKKYIRPNFCGLCGAKFPKPILHIGISLDAGNQAGWIVLTQEMADAAHVLIDELIGTDIISLSK